MPKTTFVGIKAPISGDALGIKQTIENIIEENLDSKSHPEFLQKFYRKVVNVNFDGASVMSGHAAGVQALMKKEQPGLLYTHCVAHKLELATLDAIKGDAYLLVFEENINAIFFFSLTRYLFVLILLGTTHVNAQIKYNKICTRQILHGIKLKI